MKPDIFALKPLKTAFTFIFLCLLAGTMALINGCKNDLLPYTNESITTMKVLAQNLSTNVTDTFVYINYNESRPNPPFYVDTIRLSPHTSYLIQVILLNESQSTVINMTDTIMSRADNHLILYNIDPSPGLFSAKILDKDSKGLPLGLLSTWTTSDTTNGWLRMILRQQPGTKNGTETPGTTDFEADFPVAVR